MLKKILVANRGEIALRVVRACREMGVASVAIYSDADKDALHVRLANEAVHIGPALSRKSYLNIEAIVAAARQSGADAVHPGYGFLSENPDFARACEESGLVFVGPSAASIALAGNKSAAREHFKKLGIPIIPGSDGVVSSVDEAMVIAESIGYPVIIKASGGGAAAECGLPMMPSNCPRPLQLPPVKPGRLSATLTSILKNTLKSPGTSNFRSWLTHTAIASIWGNANAAFKSATRS